MIDLFKINHLVHFYFDQYGLIISVNYNPWGNYLNCTITDQESGLKMDRTIDGQYIHGDGTNQVHGIILDYLAKRAEVLKYGYAPDQTT